MDTPEQRLEAIATGQLGMVARRQAHLMGITDRQLRSRIASGSLEQIGAHTFRLFGAERTPRADLLGLILDVGPGAYASGPTSSALHGADGFVLAPPFHVAIERSRQVRRPGHRIHTTADLDAIDRTRVGGIPTLAPARTLIELARIATPKQLTAALDSMLRDRRLTEERLHQRIVALRSKGRYGIPKLIEVIEGKEVTRGGHSWLERRFLELAARTGLPRPDVQRVLARSGTRLVRVDFRFTGTPIVVEALGYRYHSTREQLARDAARLNALLDEGFRPYQYSYDQIVERGDDVVAQLRGALRSVA